MPITIGQKTENDFSNPLGLLGDCHRRIERFLDVLIEITRQSRGALLTEDQRNGLEAALRYFREAAPKHTRDEEESLFPRMLAQADESVATALSSLDQLQDDHTIAEASHLEVEALGQRWLSEGLLSSDSIRQLTELLDGLRSTYQRHIAVEETEVFPLAGRILSKEDILDVGREMSARRSIDLGALASNLNARSGADKP